MTQFPLPMIHRNGTSAGELFDQAMSALDALRVAAKALEDMAPNARDYYPRGAGAFPMAQECHASRLARIDEIRAEVNAIAEAIDEQRSSTP